MNTAVQNELSQFAAAREQTLALTADLSQEALNRVPGPGKWSVGEIVDHLLLSERFYRREIGLLIEMAESGRRAFLRRSFADLDVSMAFLPKSLLPWMEIPLTLSNAFTPAFAKRMLARNRVFRARNPSLAQPLHGRPGADLRADLAASLEETRALFAAHPDLDYRNMRHQHPLLGINNVPELLRFASLHEQRHQDQIREALGERDLSTASA